MLILTNGLVGAVFMLLGLRLRSVDHDLPLGSPFAGTAILLGLAVVAVNLTLFVGVQANDNYTLSTVAFFVATLWGVPAGIVFLRHGD